MIASDLAKADEVDPITENDIIIDLVELSNSVLFNDAVSNNAKHGEFSIESSKVEGKKEVDNSRSILFIAFSLSIALVVAFHFTRK
jgi:hypothetical protein